MQQSELPLYPKLSSIYNKIMQLAIAIVCIIVLMEVWIYTSRSMDNSILANFTQTSRDYVTQVNHGLSALLISKDKQRIQAYIDQSATPTWIKDITYYDVTGRLLMSSSGYEPINDLYGINVYQVDVSDRYIPFVQEVRTEQLKGYLRVTLERDYFTKSLTKANYEHYELLRIMMMVAGLVGFLLTRGLNRFSRQGYRLHIKSDKPTH